MIVAGDVGGTKTNLAFFKDDLSLQKEKRYASAEHKDFASILLDFLDGERVRAICIGVAGPVKNGVCHTTNLPWILDQKDLAKQTGVQYVFLLNDLEANAHGIGALRINDLDCLQKGKPVPGNQALISAGTGLGEAGLYWNGKEHAPFACEGGHTDFGPTSQEEIDLLIYLTKKHPRVSYERILSGSGTYEIYQFLRDTGLEKEEAEIEKVADRIPQKITELAISKKSKICERVLEMFSRIYGAEAGNLALKMYATAGVYVGGGIAPKILPILKQRFFLEGFTNKGRFKSFMEDIPVSVILQEDTALLGAARFAKKRLQYAK